MPGPSTCQSTLPGGKYKLNCLLYVDDLPLLSETENGLNECISQRGYYGKV